MELCEECMQFLIKNDQTTGCGCTGILGIKYVGISKGCIKTINGIRCKEEREIRKIDGVIYEMYNCQDHTPEPLPKNYVHILNPKGQFRSLKN